MAVPAAAADRTLSTLAIRILTDEIKEQRAKQYFSIGFIVDVAEKFQRSTKTELKTILLERGLARLEPLYPRIPVLTTDEDKQRYLDRAKDLAAHSVATVICFLMLLQRPTALAVVIRCSLRDKTLVL